MSLQDVLSKSLQLTVHGDRVTDKNSFLGALLLPFTRELLKNNDPVWFPLSNIQPTSEA